MVSRVRTLIPASALLVALSLHGDAQQQPPHKPSSQQRQQQQQPQSQQPQSQQPSQPSQPAVTPQQTPDQPPLFRTGVNYVRVDVIVSDKTGNPVQDLRENDFEVLEDNRPQKIESMNLIQLDGGMQ